MTGPKSSPALVIDANALSRLIVTEMLEAMGIETVGVADWSMAEAALAQVSPRVVVLDLDVTQIQIEAANIVMTSGPEGKPLLIGIYSGGDTEIRKGYLAAGIDRLLSKPFNPAEMAAALGRPIGG